MIVLFTSNKSGGIVQLTHTFAKTLVDMGENVAIFCREDAELTAQKYQIERYSPFRTLFATSKTVTTVADRIVALNPKLVLFTDDALASAMVLLAIDKRVRCIMSVHDVTSHSGVRTCLVNKIKRFIKMVPIRKSYRMASEILLYSKTSESAFVNMYPQWKEKTLVTRLGAHLVSQQLQKPEEMENITGYVLFFGRIDAYKGVDFLLDVFRNEKQLSSLPLVVAGKAEMHFPWLHNEENANIKIIQRFIKDEEMNWLFSNASFVVLPYRDASQSGVIPIAYHYGKPVLVSDLDGLKEYVEEGKTGYVFKEKQEFVARLITLQREAQTMKQEVYCYNEKLKWETSISALLSTLNERKFFE